MIFVVILLWTLSAIVLVYGRKEESNRWLGALTFLTGCGALAVVLEEYGIQVVNTYIGVGNTNNYVMYSLIGFSSSLSHHFAPYALLMYGINNTLIFQKRFKRWKNKLKIVLLIPPIMMYMLFPFMGGYNPSFKILTIWVAPYVIMANLLLFLTFIITPSPVEKQQKLFNCLIVSPITLYALYSNFILRIFNNHEAWRFHRWFVILQFTLFIIFSARHGALGVKIKFEKHQLERTRRSISSGTAIISHTIKNEIGKISMGAESIRLYCNEPNEHINTSLEIINDSTNHLYAMISRINVQMSDIILDKSYNNVKDIVDTAINMVGCSIKKKSITVETNYYEADVVWCDEIHIREVLINILKNAIEAMEQNGQIKITLCKGKRGISLSISDNGKGIPKENLEKVLDPFFTTKKLTLNFGLGLSYCYNVMERHGGRLELISEVGVGTTVLLHFSTKRKLWNLFN
ncbi:sensor histidine kinase [Alkaliphilus hydrothermalis]|uniref:histidine kinase n=1 Tax=Alkaliphilus hydrothermalis TaxID=1482730 RepID=A0ABS2NP50_9FIRM|nr:HAMP domain-containing sensor histidine kinase [Alkaliphilus hydrothermalis]MBM7614689.1 signal transduction histidine kinase [Alkaliphilus hydrothermalis]